jgi:hypothetical protein
MVGEAQSPPGDVQIKSRSQRGWLGRLGDSRNALEATWIKAARSKERTSARRTTTRRVIVSAEAVVPAVAGARTASAYPIGVLHK